MATIGTFTKQENGYQGTIATLTINTKISITAVKKTEEKAPDYRVFAGKVEIGAAWKKTSKENHPYVSVKLDDPSFPAAIFCNLIETDGGYVLIWSR